MKTAKMMQVVFHMKSGNKVVTRCENIKISKQANDLVSYTITGRNDKGNDPLFYIRLDQIESIELLDIRPWWKLW